jgi:hypothetical protein
MEFVIIDEIYGIDLKVLFLDREDSLRGRFHPKTQTIEIDTKQPIIDQINTIAHECIHFVNWVFDRCGINHSWGNDEHFAYYFDWVFSAILHKGGFR